jgi:hypothetical protein
MNRLFGAAIIGFIIIGSSAQTIQDQYYRPSTITGAVQPRSTDFNGQWFTVGVSGQLTRVDLLIGRESSTIDQDVQITVTRLDRFANSMTAVISRIVPASSIPVYFQPNAGTSMVSIDFSDAPVAVQQGEDLVILTSSSLPPNANPKINLFGGPPNYLGGARIQTDSLSRLTAGADTSIDFGFATYVSVPEPAVDWLLACACILFVRNVVQRMRARENH